ncbi:aminoacyl-tRNA hydrolase [Texas Phoenix palm phytoplasma]|uniref:Peptidyl-tRNA hydrolase n=1 Tax=Texas Phoenix palm phytoplasma TaxID=176709 RepID=A0ABS5BIG9_9MOLU|nr:aminoacyl-tRNA hydrolase [Texas Phoenix palm phytoplasma]MBP3059376.1 aminoacyl-tRNA hydrolase [Texas Phoenix palm phytoplasma]
MKMICGLGNPGVEFESTPHNIGFMLVNYFLEKFQENICFFKKKFSSLIYCIQIQEKKFLLVKPESYMNLSGNSIYKVMQNYKIKTKDILIISDDIYLNPGSFKFKKKGGHGGHNGIKNIIDNLKTNEFKRLKIGVGYDCSVSIEKYVLKNLDNNVKNKILINFPLFYDFLINFVQGISFEKIINLVLNKNKIK